jgi:hypothetical protein
MCRDDPARPGISRAGHASIYLRERESMKSRHRRQNCENITCFIIFGKAERGLVAIIFGH